MKGFSEDEAAKEREIVSVIESPNGSESVSGTVSQLLHGAGRSRAIDWFFVGTWTGVSELEGLKKCEEIMIACFKVAGGLPEFKFPPPTLKKIGPFMRKSVGFFDIS